MYYKFKNIYYDVKSWWEYLKYFFSYERPKKKYIQQLKTSDSAIIFGTGPSLKSFDFDKVGDLDCYSVSNFFLHSSSNKINLRAHFFAPWHQPLDKDNYFEWLKKADEELNKNVAIFLGEKDYEEILKRKIFEKRKRFFLSLTSRKTPRRNIFGPIVAPPTGPLMILPLVVGLGYKKVYFAGCDHNTLRDYKKNIKHFYNTECDPRKNASDINSWEDITRELQNNLEIFKLYKEYFKRNKNINFYNTSREGWLDFVEYYDGFDVDITKKREEK